jgi:putative transferase (TIGR04331 family)
MIKKLIILKDKKIQKKSNIFYISHSVCPNPYTVEEKDYLQNPLKNRKFFDSSYQYISQLYNKVAGSLAEKLNKIHGVNYSKRYWEILFNTWLRIFLTSSYDKWLRVKNLKNKKNFFFETYEINEDKLIFKNTKDFTMSYTKEDPKYSLYNYQIYSQILQLFYIKKKKTNKKFIIKNNFEKFDQKTLLQKLVSFLINLKNFISKKKIVIINKVNILSNFQLLFNINFFFLNLKYNLTNDNKIFKTERKLKVNFISANRFENFISRNLMQNIPKSFLEDYKRIKNFNLSKILADRLIYYTPGDCDYEKLFLSESTLVNCKLAYCQHGGGYGQLKYLDEEIDEVGLSDYYLTYGWTYDQFLKKSKKYSRKIIPFFPFNFSNKKEITKKNRKKILIVLDSVPAEILRFRSIPLLEDYNKTVVKKIIKLLLSLDKNLLNSIDIRLPNRFSQQKNLVNYLTSFGLKINYIKAEDSLVKQFADYKAIIFTGMYTSYLEAMYKGMNFYIFNFEKAKSKFRESFLKDYETLKKKKIIIDNYKEMKSFLNNILKENVNYFNENKQYCLKSFRKKYLRDNNYKHFLFFSKNYL